MHRTITDRKLVLASAVVCIGVLATSGAHAQGKDAISTLGQFEFRTSCAACHGENGKGNGPVAEVLSKKPSDLTQLARQNSGKFPAELVAQVIDGRKMINPHGDRKMPVWGLRYLAEEVQKAGRVPHDVNAEEMVLGRITALTQYIESIQSK